MGATTWHVPDAIVVGRIYKGMDIFVCNVKNQHQYANCVSRATSGVHCSLSKKCFQKGGSLRNL